ncbi:hypothetical protein ANN_10962 [Periplaneta americana]|uniref:Uncharacterized protein n=1 Tax=Periplaneta americana TaxID=6978 RepID=A0ABQ8T5G4_PERAM|nr:hypothetical protein ANN_10962 [Periplaneta americana]
MEDVRVETCLTVSFHYDGGCSTHFAHVVNEQFPNRWIGWDGPLRWPAWSPEITLLDFFLWSAVKGRVYQEAPNNNLTAVKKTLEGELQKCNSSCKESLEKYVANMSTNADFQQGIAPIEIDRQLCQVYEPNVMSKQMVRCSTRSSVMMVGLPLRSSSCTFWCPAENCLQQQCTICLLIDLHS